MRVPACEVRQQRSTNLPARPPVTSELWGSSSSCPTTAPGRCLRGQGRSSPRAVVSLAYVPRDQRGDLGLFFP